jgi:hypothetical protein
MMERVGKHGEHQKGFDSHVRHASADSYGQREKEDDHRPADSGHRM